MYATFWYEVLLISFTYTTMKKSIATSIFMTGFLFLALGTYSQDYIADYTKAKEGLLRSIPVEYINKARTELVIAYQHTSHGTHVSRGVFGLQDYKPGDNQLFGVALSSVTGKLEFRDYALGAYAPDGVSGFDLSVDETAFIQTTRNYLDAPENASVNVVMWSWCDIAGHNPAGNYLPGMATLRAEYGPGGSKIGSGEGERAIPVTFIYMTGHANKDANTGPLNPKEQAALIIDHCNTNQQFCLDYYSIDTHNMDDTYYEDASDDAVSDSYGGNFYADWQNSHTLGVDYFASKVTPGGDVDFGSHNTQYITSNRKGYALWWILARIAGWSGDDGDDDDDGDASAVFPANHDDFKIYPNPGTGIFSIEATQLNINEIKVVNSVGTVVKIFAPSEFGTDKIDIDLTGIQPGLYFVQLSDNELPVYSSILIIN